MAVCGCVTCVGCGVWLTLHQADSQQAFQRRFRGWNTLKNVIRKTPERHWNAKVCTSFEVPPMGCSGGGSRSRNRFTAGIPNFV
jgi:hypothetical protein